MNEEFYTHYDLHAGNVLLSKVPDNKYVKIRYEYEDGSLYEIYTKYIPVIIDYRRSYFNFESFGSEFAGFNSKNVYDIMCSTSCNESVATDRRDKSCSSGSGFFSERLSSGDYSDNEHNFYINPVTKNVSYDLRYIKELILSISQSSRIPNFNIYNSLMKYANNPKWCDPALKLTTFRTKEEIISYKKGMEKYRFSGPEIIAKSFSAKYSELPESIPMSYTKQYLCNETNQDPTINNLTDCFSWLHYEYVTNYARTFDEMRGSGVEVFGTMTIYPGQYHNWRFQKTM